MYTKKEILGPVQCPASMKHRIKWAQVGVGTFAVLGIACFIIGSNLNNGGIVIASLSLACVAFLHVLLVYFTRIFLLLW